MIKDIGRHGRNVDGGSGGRNMGGKRGDKQDALRDKIYSMPSMSLTHKINEDMIMIHYLNITVNYIVMIINQYMDIIL